MSGPYPSESSRHRTIPSFGLSASKIAVAAVLTLVAATQNSCTSMWQQARERERLFSVESARNSARNGQCDSALSSLDRAQATLDLGTFARESTTIRAHCYERLGLAELAKAHRQLLTDFYVNEPVSSRGPDGSPAFRVADVLVGDHSPLPSSLKIEPPRYNVFARRSGIVGRVVISFGLSKAGKPTMIRVLEMPHTLLATWAIEAVATSKLRQTEGSVTSHGNHYLTILRFQWRWAKGADAEQGP